MNDMTFPTTAMDAARKRLFERLDALQIPAPVVPYPRPCAGQLRRARS